MNRLRLIISTSQYNRCFIFTVDMLYESQQKRTYLAMLVQIGIYLPLLVGLLLFYPWLAGSRKIRYSQENEDDENERLLSGNLQQNH